jgi:hypothetical protein
MRTLTTRTWTRTPDEASPPPDTDPDELAGEADRIAGEQAREVVLLARLGLTGAMAADATAAAGFASGMPLDTAPGSLELARFAEDAAGPDDRYRDASDDELAGAKAAFRVGTLSEHKAAIIASATALLDPDQARAAEAKVLDRAGTLTPPGLRAAITRAVMEVAPGTARRWREHEAAKARVERWAEASGNAGLAGRELPPAQVLAADR